MTLSLLLVAVAEEAAEGGLGGPFALEPGLIIWTWIVFGFLLYGLWKIAWPPIVRLTEEREQRIAAQLAEAERLGSEAKATVERHQKLLEGAKQEAQALINMNLAVASHRTNEVMRVLTVFSAFFLPLTFLVGVYGMNFRYMPELERRWGYPTALVVMALISVVIFFWFRRRGWLAGRSDKA